MDAFIKKIFSYSLIVFLLILPFDKAIYQFLLPLSNSSLGTFWAHFADFAGSGQFQLAFVFLFALIYSYRKRENFWKLVLLCCIAIALAGGMSQILKIAIGRPRPGMLLPSWDIEMFTVESDFHSFPSGHAAAVFSLAFCLCHFVPRLGCLWLILGIVVSLGRVVGQAHFLSDVVGGAVLGLFCAWIVLENGQVIFDTFRRFFLPFKRVFRPAFVLKGFKNFS